MWDAHTVRLLPSGQTQLFIELHLVHEVTSPQAFDALRARGWPVRFPDRTFATVDHIVPTRELARPFPDELAEQMLRALERNCREFGVPLWGLDHANQGIVHVIGPELGLTQLGLTIACGDSHTSTHGAFGALAFGIGTSEVEMVLATQCLLQRRPKSFEVRVDGRLSPGVTKSICRSWSSKKCRTCSRARKNSLSFREMIQRTKHCERSASRGQKA